MSVDNDDGPGLLLVCCRAEEMTVFSIRCRRSNGHVQVRHFSVCATEADRRTCAPTVKRFFFFS